MASYVQSRIIFHKELPRYFIEKLEDEGLLQAVVPLADVVRNTSVPTALMTYYHTFFVGNDYKVDDKCPDEYYQLFKNLESNKEEYGFSDLMDYTDFVGTSDSIDEEFHDHELFFYTKWSTLSTNFLKELAKICPDFSYFYSGEELWGGEIDYRDGELEYDTGWTEPLYSIKQVEIDGRTIGIYHLEAWDKDGYSPGYYRDEYFDNYLGESLQRAIEKLKEDGL